MEKKQVCTYCRRRLDIGMDVIAVQHGVQGHHRFVPLEEPLAFCSEQCVRNHLDDVPSITPRIP